MVQLLKMKERFYQFIGRFEIYVMAAVRFVVAYVAFSLINSTTGYMEILSDYPIALILALLCSFFAGGADDVLWSGADFASVFCPVKGIVSDYGAYFYRPVLSVSAVYQQERDVYYAYPAAGSDRSAVHDAGCLRSAQRALYGNFRGQRRGGVFCAEECAGKFCDVFTCQ